MQEKRQKGELPLPFFVVLHTGRVDGDEGLFHQVGLQRLLIEFDPQAGAVGYDEAAVFDGQGVLEHVVAPGMRLGEMNSWMRGLGIAAIT